MATIWQKPDFSELVMNAEIGSYQADFDAGDPPPLVEDESEEAAALPASEGA